MAKMVADPVLDAALAKIATCTHMVVCSSQPANFAAIAAATLASKTMTAGLGGASYTAADDASGRKVTMTAATAVSVTATGTATHIAMDDGTTLLYVTTCTSQALTSGNTVDIPAWKIGIADPT
jgi:hypothetical protein